MADTASRTYEDPALYDLIYSWYDVDIPFYVARARASRGPVLEVACGTGRILIPILQSGVDADGFDLHPQMLEHLRSKAAALNLAPRVVQADMRDFTMQRRYSQVIVPFRAFLHNLTTDDQIATLRCCREHLEPGGEMLFNVFHPNMDFIVEHDGKPMEERRIAHPETGLPVVIASTPRFDRVRQLLTSERTVRWLDAAGRTTAERHIRFTLRWVYLAELELLLRCAGFSRWEIRGGFDGRPLASDADELVVTAWRD